MKLMHIKNIITLNLFLLTIKGMHEEIEKRRYQCSEENSFIQYMKTKNKNAGVFLTEFRRMIHTRIK